MPLNVGDTGYGSMAGAALSSSVAASEAAPLLMPEPEQESVRLWKPMSREQLEAAAGGPGWRRVRFYLVLVFWLAWLAILATAVAIIILSPKPVVPILQWWQKALFYQVKPQHPLQADGSLASSVTEQLPYLRSLGIGAVILQGLFDKKTSPLNLPALSKNLGTLAQIQHLLTETNKANVKVVLDFCDLDLVGPEDPPSDAVKLSNISGTVKPAVRFWMEQGVAGFAVCDTDLAYSEKTLLEWRAVFKEFSRPEEERIVVVKQTRDILLPPSDSSQLNVTLVDVVMTSILPRSRHSLSAPQVAQVVETHLQSQDDNKWISWTVGAKASYNLKQLLLVLVMTLPGSPTVQYDEETDPTQNVSLTVDSSINETAGPSDIFKDKENKPSVLFNSLSHSRSREEALLYGSFTFLPFNASSSYAESPNSTISSPPSAPILAFLRSWGCVHFLIILNVGPRPHALDPDWAPSLPEAGVFVSSTGMNRLGSTSLYTLEVQPYEAIVIKLFQAGSYS